MCYAISVIVTFIISCVYIKWQKQFAQKWFTEVVLPRLPPKSCIVIDNASYHTVLTDGSRAPTTSSRKNEIQEWLKAKGIQ